MLIGNHFFVFFVCRSTVVSLRSPQDRRPLLQVLPLMPPYPLTWRAAGRVTVYRNTKGRQRIPSRGSVRGSSAINCPWCSAVRGDSRDRSRLGWMRVKLLGRTITLDKSRSKSSSGWKYGITQAMLSIEDLWKTWAANVRYSFSSKTVHWEMVLKAGMQSSVPCSVLISGSTLLYAQWWFFVPSIMSLTNS